MFPLSSLLLFILQAALLLLSLANCSLQRVPVETENGGQLKYYRYLFADRYNLPKFQEPLLKRPTASGSSYYILYQQPESEEGQMGTTTVFEIKISEPPPPGKPPLQVVFTWTKRGFHSGVKASAKVTDVIIRGRYFGGSNGEEVLVVTLAIVALPVVVSSIGGLFIGAGKAVFQQLDFSSKKREEFFISSRSYEYDDRERLVKETLYAYDKEYDKKWRPLSVRQHFYSGAAKLPFQAVITNKLTGKKRRLPVLAK